MLERLFALTISSSRRQHFALPAALMFGLASFAQAATWTVDNTGDPASPSAANCAPPSANTCTLRDALAAAGDGDSIGFDVGSSQTITLTSNVTLLLNHSVTIDGSGSPGLVIDGNDAVTVFTAPSSKPSLIERLSIVHGQASFSGTYGISGGAIAVAGGGTLTVDHVQISNNAVGTLGGVGGGIYNQGSLNLLNSTVSGNSASQAAGLWNEGFMSMANSTVSSNTGSNGITLDDTAVVTNSTLESVYVYYSGTVNFANTILVGCSHPQPTINDYGGNFEDGTGCLGAVPSSPTSKSNAYLNLGPLQNNGGPTLTRLPGKGSDVIDAGRDDLCAATPVNGTDQRGVPRPQGAHCDAGAVEVSLCYVRFDAVGANDGASWDDAYTDLQSALADSRCSDIWVARGVYKPTATADRSISFAIGSATRVYGGFSGIGAQRDPMLYSSILSGDIDGNDSGTNGVDSNTGQIVGDNSYHVVTMDGTTAAGPITSATLLDGFTITGGMANGGNYDDDGGGLFCNGTGAICSPALNQLVFSGNFANQGGGAIYNLGLGGTASMRLTNSTFSGNAATDGGAIFDNGEAGVSSPAIANVTFANNSASDCGGAVYNMGLVGAANPTISNATFSANFGNASGGALCDTNGYPLAGQANPALTNVVLWNNGTAIYNPYSAGTAGSTLDHVVIDNGCPDNSLACSNLSTADPKLGALQDNGGATPTMMPGTGSSAIDAGLDATCSAAPVANVDQRGLARPQSTHCDIGAVEASDLSLSISDLGPFGIYGKPSQYIVTLQNHGGTTIAGVQVSGLASAALDDAGAHWACTGGICTTSQTAGPFADTATIPAGGTLTWLITETVFETSDAATATLTIHSSAAASASDTDTLAIFRGTFDGP